MPEIELKLDITPEALETLKASGLFSGPSGTVEQRSIYFDTRDNRLEKKGFSLRIRRSGDALAQTVKATGRASSVFARSEWEMPVMAEEPVVDSTTPLASEFGNFAGELLSRFAVNVVRQTWEVMENKARIEVSADQGEVIAEERRLSVCELELELKEGEPIDLFRLARKIETIIPVKINVQSKAEQGYRLLDAAPAAVRAEPLRLEADDTAEQAFRMIAGSCFRQFRLNEVILLRRRNAGAALHQARVALRRLRSAFAVFKTHLGDEAERLSDEFRWLAGMLGEARDLDVLDIGAAAPASHEKLRAARKTAYEAAIAALSSSRSRALVIDFNEWLQSGSYRQEPALNKPVVDFARHALDKRRRKLKTHGKHLAALTDDERHQVRKDAKKLRYAAEFFRSLFDGKQGSRHFMRFSRVMEQLQEQLGALNDLVAGPVIAEKCGLGDLAHSGSRARADDKAKRIERSQAMLDELLEAKRFWH